MHEEGVHEKPIPPGNGPICMYTCILRKMTSFQCTMSQDDKERNMTSEVYPRRKLICTNTLHRCTLTAKKLIYTDDHKG